MNKPRLYFDTSVFGGVYDIEFQKETLQLLTWSKKEKLFVYFQT
jgi:hypothetical protein